MNTGISENSYAGWHDERTVYIRETMEPNCKSDRPIYAVHLADGTRVALLPDRQAAFAAALQYDFTPVSVH